MSEKIPPALRKLESEESSTYAAVERIFRRFKEDISGLVSLKSRHRGASSSASYREKLFRGIRERADDASVAMSKKVEELCGKSARYAYDATVSDLRAQSVKNPILRFSMERVKRYFEMIRPDNAKNLAAVFTDKMADGVIRKLRVSLVDVYRDALVQGMTANQIQKALQEKWDKLARDINTSRFVDASGRKWDNSNYLQMLVRTTSQRVYNESTIDTLVSNGFKFARISSDGDGDCPVCARWEGRIIQMAGKRGKYPTYEDAKGDGMFHPNCTHRLEYIDEDELKEADRGRG